jgi:hypothetical protein
MIVPSSSGLVEIMEKMGGMPSHGAAVGRHVLFGEHAECVAAFRDGMLPHL